MGRFGKMRVGGSRFRDERGMTLVELMVSLAILSTALFALAYTSTIGFRYTARARQHESATAVANQVIEQVRAVQLSLLENGLSTADVTADPAIVPCGTYKCYPWDGVNERIVQSTDGAGVPPLTPNYDTLRVTGTEFSYRTYLTYPGAYTSSNMNQLHLITVVTWTPAVATSTALLRMDSVLETTTSCSDANLHPFGGPCGTVYSGNADIPAGGILIRPTLTSSGGLLVDAAQNVDRVEALFPALGGSVESEQVYQVSGSDTTAGILRTFYSGGVESYTQCGMVGSSSSSDNDGTGPDPPYSSMPTGSNNDTFCATSPFTITGGVSALTATKSLVDTPATGRSISTTSAGGANACNGQSDSKPCTYNSDLQVGTFVVQDIITENVGSLGVCNLLQTATATSPSSVYVHKVEDAANNKVAVAVTRTFPRSMFGCLPLNLLAANTITSADWLSSAITFKVGDCTIAGTTCNSYRQAGDPVVVTRSSNTAYNGVYTVLASPAPDKLGFSVTKTTDPGVFAGTATATSPWTLAAPIAVGSQKGFLVSLQNYRETITLEAGTGSAAPSVSRSGSLWFWIGGANPSTVCTGTGFSLLPGTVDGTTVNAYCSVDLATAAYPLAITPSPAPTLTKVMLGAQANKADCATVVASGPSFTVPAIATTRSPATGSVASASAIAPNPLPFSFSFKALSTHWDLACTPTTVDLDWTVSADLGTATASASGS